MTTYSNADGSASVRNQIEYEYGTHGKVTHRQQDHNDAVGTGSSH